MGTLSRCTTTWLLACALVASAADAAASTLRIACDKTATGGEVTVNGKFKGECPIDVQVAAGTITIKVVKDRATAPFTQTVKIGDDVVKRIDVSFARADDDTGRAKAGGTEADSPRPTAAADAAQTAKLLEQQRYKIELTQYQNSIKACLPSYSAELKKRRAAYLRAYAGERRQCKAEHPTSGESGNSEVCGNSNPDDNVIPIFADTERGEWEELRDTTAEKWCAEQFTKPTPPRD